ncbi:MAG: tetratricopeptide repeat protein, partial [Jaaginema sp. PMC 1078.18]|nr:tetratricopeptide repeat protein [Jaaginema sp. PMC 1078.18]
YNDLGELQQALDYYNQALSIVRAVGDRSGEATTLNNIGVIYSDLGEKQQALDYYNQALLLKRAVGDKGGEASTLSNIGVLYNFLGEKQQALDYLNQALPILRTVGDKGGEASTLSNIGLVYSSLGEKQQALDYYNQALPLRRAVGDRRGEASTLSNIGLVYSSLGNQQQALDYYNQALPILRTVGDRRGEATTLNNIGLVYNSLGEKQQALNYYNQALPLRRDIGDRNGEANSLYNLAASEYNRGKFATALPHIEAAIEIIEDLRSKIGSQELRTSYFATVQNYYQLYIDLLMRLHQQNPNQGYDAQALHISERARARSLLELLAEANADIRTGVDPELLEQEQNLLQQLNAVEHRRYQLATEGYSDSEINEIKAQSQALLNQLDQLEAQIRINSPRYADLQYPEPLTLGEIQRQVLDEDTLLLQYSLGPYRSYLWAVTKDSITSYELPSEGEINALAQQFHEQLQSPSAPNQDLALQLSEMILSPVASQLGNKRLLVVGDGALQYVPFAALPAPNAPETDNPLGYTPLLVQHEIVTSSSASTVAISRRTLANRSPGSKMLAVLADPVFEENDARFAGVTARDDEANPNLERSLLGIGEAGQSLNRLQYTRDEAEAILALVPESQRLEALDFEAERELITSADLADYQIVHLATHGLLNEQNPELSGLVLSLFEETGEPENGFLRLHDIFNLNLPAELVVLSACETGLGENVRGEGLVGLTRGFMYAGAKRVVVSLWKVNDVQTSVLMTQFYERMLQEEQNPVAALRVAQLEMWEAGKSPYYWAAFTVQGDWR